MEKWPPMSLLGLLISLDLLPTFYVCGISYLFMNIFNIRILVSILSKSNTHKS